MVATGAVLFMVKRRTKHLGEFGRATARVYGLIESLNVAAIAGLALACIGYLWANRLVPVELAHRHDWELATSLACGCWRWCTRCTARPPGPGTSNWARWPRCVCCCRC
jgi:uncharacterized membrane-anchored protein